MTERISAAAARRVLLILTFTRWFPVGLTVGVSTLLAVERGMSLAEVGVIFAVQGFVVLGLELPTGGFADALGRRPVLMVVISGRASWVIGVLSGYCARRPESTPRVRRRPTLAQCTGVRPACRPVRRIRYHCETPSSRPWDAGCVRPQPGQWVAPPKRPFRRRRAGLSADKQLAVP